MTKSRPEIFNTDQGVHYTSRSFTEVLEKRGVQISMDGKGRALDTCSWRVMAKRETGGVVPEVVRERVAGGSGAGEVFSILQHESEASVTEIPDPSGGVCERCDMNEEG